MHVRLFPRQYELCDQLPIEPNRESMVSVCLCLAVGGYCNSRLRLHGCSMMITKPVGSLPQQYVLVLLMNRMYKSQTMSASSTTFDSFLHEVRRSTSIVSNLEERLGEMASFGVIPELEKHPSSASPTKEKDVRLPSQ